jgi:hypothetical protein
MDPRSRVRSGCALLFRVYSHANLTPFFTQSRKVRQEKIFAVACPLFFEGRVLGVSFFYIPALCPLKVWSESIFLTRRCEERQDSIFILAFFAGLAVRSLDYILFIQDQLILT